MGQLLWALLCCGAARSAEVIAVPALESCLLCSAAPSLTMYWKGQNSKAVLLLIPGGEGFVGLKEGQTELGYHQFQTLKRLTEPTLTSGHFDVVLLDSPAPLSPRQAYPAARAGFDHLIRIESAIRYYQHKTGLPVWLMGHSNGGISLTEFLQFARKRNTEGLIAGMVVSSARSESHFEAPIAFPMLFMHHQSDGCVHTLLQAAKDNYDKVKAFNAATTQWVMIQSGQAQSGDPCRSGFHMYYGAGEEVAGALDSFLSRSYP